MEKELVNKLKYLINKKKSLQEICNELELKDYEVIGIVELLKQDGFLADYIDGEIVKLKKPIKNDDVYQVPAKNGKIKFIALSDIHYGREFDSDGIEISVHLNPAPDHELVQGRQFSNEEFDKFQNDQDATSYDGILFPAISDETGHDRRAISQYNCYHYIFPIVLGVSKPEYNNEQLQEIIDNNEKGFELDGKHYTNYQGTQMQRNLERKIREQKDIQILAKESDNKELIAESQKNITQLTQKYRELLQVSGLSTKMNRLKVSRYKRVAKSKLK